MKKMLALAVLVGMTLTGCVKDESAPALGGDRAISFEVANYVNQTRANVNFATTETFGAYVWHNDGGTLTQMTTADYATVKHDGTNWVPTTKLYWPHTGSVDCQAFHPESLDSGINLNAAANEMSITYTVLNAADPADPNPDHDIMFADRAYRYEENATNPFSNGFNGIPTLFHHALAKLNFKVALNDQLDDAAVTWSVVINSITISDVYVTGTLNLTTSIPATGTGYVAWSGAWTPTAATTTHTWVQTSVVNEDVPAVDYDAQTYYVLPQTLAAGKQKLTINYTLTQSSTGVADIVETYEKTVDLYPAGGTGLTEWAMNKNITYTITIGTQANAILFAPAVVDWVNDDSGSIAI